MRTNAGAFGWWWPVMMAVVLSACSILPPSAPQDIYRLPPSSVTPSTGETVNRSLRISRPSANELLASARIVVVPEGNRLSVYEGVRWSSPAPLLWRDQLLESFQIDGRIAQLSRAENRLQADIELDGVLSAFQVEYRDGSPEVVIQFDALLVATASRRILASRQFAVRETVSGSSVPAVVKAFGRAGDELAMTIIDWALQHFE